MTRFGLIFVIHGIETGWDNTVRLDDGPTVACDMNAIPSTRCRAVAPARYRDAVIWKSLALRSAFCPGASSTVRDFPP